ncbi:MAG: hypothetical protein J1F12_06320 [Muribaculaceae bacterium]|nr:hypothetical protein [Muribaculaceae bacterium]
MKRYIDKAILLLFGILIMLLTACRDELLYNNTGVPEEGLPATVSLKVNIGREIIGSRYAGFVPGDEATSRIEHLWIGVFNVATGSLITQVELNETKINQNHEPYGTITLKDLPLSSGTCYIVGVANSDSNQGVVIEESGNKADSKGNLLSILRDIETWEEFKKVSFLLSNPESVSRVSGNFVMCGSYYEGNVSHSRDDLWDDEGNPNPVYIYPGTQTLSGAIHLQRLDSYVKFILKAGENVTITPVSWQVKNIPSVSFLHERKGSCEADGSKVINAADTKKTGVLWIDYGTFENFYNNSQVFLTNTFSKERDDNYSLTGNYSFDFYQLENKHKGIINASPSDANGNNVYNERESEFKAENSGENTGWYKSLVRNPGSSTPSSEPSLRNNNASFVELRVQVEYYYEAGDEDYKPVNPENNSEKTLIHRVANAVYTVHLGYVKYGDKTPDVNDFNCLRNTSTTYTITISGADNIRVEAVDGNLEKESGAEGTVTDINETMINMDCHYGVFNIKLSDNARRNLIWRIRAPYGEQYIDMASGEGLKDYSSPSIINLSDGKHESEKEALPDNQFYNWVQIVPTDGPNVIKSYPGDRRLLKRVNREGLPEGYELSAIKTPESGGVWYLEELRDPENFPHHLKQTGDGDDKEFYYTVFIDEYIYEHEYDQNSPSMTVDQVVYNNWKNYANRDYRKLWIRLGTPEISNDGESIYSNSQYMLTQESIQTFYNNQAESCFGIEHINETYNGEPYSTDAKNYKSQNGRKNLQSFRNNYFDSSDKNINTLLGNELQKGRRSGTLTDSPEVIFYINSHEHDYMTGALARNRDLNNNGIIDDFEIRWYLPVVQTYTRIQLGTVSLKTPLFNLQDYAPDEIAPGTGTVYSHYAASDDAKLWAEELIATGTITNYGEKAGTMRCIRNLGENPGDDIGNDNNVQTAYEYNEETREVSMTYYRTVGLRPETSNHIPTHYAGEILSYPARRFKVAKYNVKPSNTTGITDLFTTDGNINENGEINKDFRYGKTPLPERLQEWENLFDDNTIGKAYFEEPDRSDQGTWRVPNINELAIMNFLGILEGKSHISCTREYFNGREHYFLGRNSTGAITTEFSAPFYIVLVKDIIQ